jgi:hypothetical protein
MQMIALKAAVLSVAGALCVASAQGAPLQESQSDGRSLQGTWLIQISLADCSTGAPIGAPFLSLGTYARGGTTTDTTSNGSFYPAVRGPGHGVWQRTGDHSYRALSMAFITLNGALTRIQTIDQKIDVQSDDSFQTTSAAVTFTKPDGTLLGGGCAKATGTRLEISGP